MQFLNVPIRTFFSYREERLVSLYEHAIESQEKWFNYMIENGLKTKFGKDFEFTPSMTYEEFISKVAVSSHKK